MNLDFGVLQAIRSCVLNSTNVKKTGVQQVYLSTPQTQELPVVFIEIEEIWTSMIPLPGDVLARIKLKASCWAQNGQNRKSITIANTLRREIDGNRMALEEGKSCVFRFLNSIIDLPHPTRPATVQHYFDVSVRNPA
jgi:hypothetical protein